jgi:hypothetical protein
MDVDDQLQLAFDTIAERLRQSIIQELDSAIAELSSIARAERGRVVADRDGIAADRDRIVAEHERTSADREHAMQEALEAARAASAKRPAPAADSPLTDSIRAIGRGRSLSEILDALAHCAAREASRVAVLIVRGQRYRGWRFLGFDPPIERPESVDLAPGEARLIADAVRDNAPVSGDAARAAGALPFAPLGPNDQAMAVPMAIAGEVVALLYADGASVAADRLDVYAQHAARCLEALVAIKAAHGAAPRGARPNGVGPEIARGGEDHAAAQRYAQLLVSEIKLYHEAEVLAGRRERDLGTRLGGEIARARALYELHVAPHVLSHADHFRAELVRTLADGDPGLLEVGT